MKELSLHVADIVQNSVDAGASAIKISVSEDTMKNILEISVEDNGKGMSEEFVSRVVDPFTTSRTTRRVGLGIPLFKQAAELCGGDLSIESALGVGTKLTATFIYDHIDRQPIGDMVATILCAVVSHDRVHFIYEHSFNDKSFVFDTKELRNVLGNVGFYEPDVYMWIKSCLEEGENEIQN